jgi:hypothetical protein
MPGAGYLVLTNNSDDRRAMLAWKFRRGPAVAASDFGDPTTTERYALCLYDDGTLVMAAAVDASATWRAVGSRGWRYDDPAGAQHGVTQAKLLSGGAGRSRVEMRGKGANLPMPNPAAATHLFAATASVRAQLHGSNDRCYETAFTPATVRRNDERKFRAKF